MQGLKIIEIVIENYKKIKAFYKRLDGQNMEVAGAPGQGKTTAISW